MHTTESFNALADEIMALGYDETTAAHYAACIGDTPTLDEHGKVIVAESDGRELARLRLKFYSR